MLRRSVLPSNRPATPLFSPACWELGFQAWAQTQSCPTLCDPMNRSTPGLPVYHQLPEFTQTHVHRVSDAIQPSHPLSSPSPPPACRGTFGGRRKAVRDRLALQGGTGDFP